MIYLSVENVRKQYGDAPLLTDVSFEVRPGERISLIGPNGCGKTTLLRILTGEEEADAGRIERHASVHMGHLQQRPEMTPGATLWEVAESALESLQDLQREMIEVSNLLETDPNLAERYDHLQQELEARDAYNLSYKIEKVLGGLGFAQAEWQKEAASLSGGEMGRLALAQLLLAEPNVMLLDEPSNHLDIAATEWLEDFLLNSRAAIFFVSHDRRFLDRIANRTLELVHGSIDPYNGNFSAYIKQKSERLLVQQRTYDKQQTEIAKMEDFIRRHHAGQKHTLAEDRRKKLERIERVPLPREIPTPAMAFPQTERSGEIVLRAEHLTKSYGEVTLFDDLSATVTRREKWGLVGPNGCGKSTLLGCLLGKKEADSGEAHLGVGVTIGYFDQQLALLDDDDEVVDAVRPEGTTMTFQERRDTLARFGIVGDKATQKVGELSGGERCRVAMARLAASKPNFLILDEPTNHLDLWAREGLTEALKKYDGTVLTVSHDRHFLDQVIDYLLVFETVPAKKGSGEEKRVQKVQGGWDVYSRLRKQQLADRNAPAAKTTKVEPAPKKEAPAKRKRKFPFRKVEELEADIFEQESRIEEVQALMADPETLRNTERVKELVAETRECKEKLAKLYEHWEEATELNW